MIVCDAAAVLCVCILLLAIQLHAPSPHLPPEPASCLLLRGLPGGRLVLRLHLHLTCRSILGSGWWIFWLRSLASLPPLGGGGPPPLCLTAGRLLLLAGIRLREVGALAVGTLGNGVLAPLPLSDPAPLDEALMVLRGMPLRAPPATGGGPGAFRSYVTPLAAVVTAHIWPLFVGLSSESLALEPQSSSSDKAIGLLVLNCKDHRRRLDDPSLESGLDAGCAAQPPDCRGDGEPLVLRLKLLAERVRAIRSPAQEASNWNRVDLQPPPGSPGLKACDCWVGLACCLDHRVSVFQQLAGIAGGSGRAPILPASVRKRSWTRALAPMRWSVLLMAA